MKYKVVIFDIGKTLLDKDVSASISQCVIDDIRLLQSKGVKVGVCTMRTLAHCRKILPVELDFYICLNGSYISCEGERIFHSPIDIKPEVKDFLSYGDAVAYYSTNSAKHKALDNGFLVDRLGVSTLTYSYVFFDVDKDNFSNFEKYNIEYWEKTKTVALQNLDSSKCKGIQRVLD